MGLTGFNRRRRLAEEGSDNELDAAYLPENQGDGSEAEDVEAEKPKKPRAKKAPAATEQTLKPASDDSKPSPLAGAMAASGDAPTDEVVDGEQADPESDADGS
jgi:hypothetical protein